MELEAIAEVRIDESGRLCLVPESRRFPYIYREAMEVHWESEGAFLCSPPPRKWSYAQWFQQIVSAAEQQGYRLRITPSTRWSDVSPELKSEIEALQQ